MTDIYDNDEILNQKLHQVSTGIWLRKFNIKETDLKGKKVLEVGSGWGALCIYIASLGASRVIGIDTNEEMANLSRENLLNYPNLKNIVEFSSSALKYLDEYDFDFVFSQCTFEHVDNLDDLLKQISKRLKPGGRLCTSFGPLWNAPFGDHRRFHRKCKELDIINIPQVLLPWSHLILPESFYLATINRFHRNGIKTETLYQGINKMAYRDYLQSFKGSELVILNIQVQYILSSRFGVLYRLQRIPILKEYFAQMITATLVKK